MGLRAGAVPRLRFGMQPVLSRARLACRFYEPNEGDIYLEGKPASVFSRGEWAKAISMVGPALFTTLPLYLNISDCLQSLYLPRGKRGLGCGEAQPWYTMTGNSKLQGRCTPAHLHTAPQTCMCVKLQCRGIPAKLAAHSASCAPQPISLAQATPHPHSTCP